MATSIQVTFDCADPDRLARFWAEVLGYELQGPPEGFGSWDEALDAWGVPANQRNMASAIVDPKGKGPRLYFQQVDTPKPEKNRVHLDLHIGGPNTEPEKRWARIVAEAERVEGLGATRQREGEQFGQRWIVMQDPEGNEFCVD